MRFEQKLAYIRAAGVRFDDEPLIKTDRNGDIDCRRISSRLAHVSARKTC